MSLIDKCISVARNCYRRTWQARRRNIETAQQILRRHSFIVSDIFRASHARPLHDEGSDRGMGDVGVDAGVVNATSCRTCRNDADLDAVNDLKGFAPIRMSDRCTA